MDAQPNALTTAAPGEPARRTSVAAVHFAIVGVVAVAVLLLWAIAIAEPIVAFLIAVALAATWCLWLEKHPEPRAGSDTPRSEAARH